MLPDWLKEIEGHIKQYRELQQLESDLAPVLRVGSTEESTTRMGVRLAMEREIQGRKDYLAEFITLHVVEHCVNCGMLSKCQEQQTNHSGM